MLSNDADIHHLMQQHPRSGFSKRQFSILFLYSPVTASPHLTGSHYHHQSHTHKNSHHYPLKLFAGDTLALFICSIFNFRGCQSKGVLFQGLEKNAIAFFCVFLSHFWFSFVFFFAFFVQFLLFFEDLVFFSIFTSFFSGLSISSTFSSAFSHFVWDFRSLRQVPSGEIVKMVEQICVFVNIAGFSFIFAQNISIFPYLSKFPSHLEVIGQFQQKTFVK